MIQVDDSGKIISINAPQSNSALKNIAIRPPIEVLRNPKLYRWDGKSFKLFKQAQDKQDQIKKRHQAKRYLEATDFYVARKIETNKPIPSAISEKRARARKLLTTALPDFE